MDTVYILKKLVQFNTVEDKENNRIITWIAEYLESCGFTNRMLIDETTNKINLFSTIGTEQIITFSGHTDTVTASGGWKRDPFSFIDDGEKLYGLGTCDMKGGIASFLAAVAEIDDKKLKRGINVLLTYDEEIGFKGITNFLSSGVKFSRYVIIPEPTEMKPIVASKGCLGLKLKFKGKSAHASEPQSGINAILNANGFINDLINYSEGIKQETNNSFAIPYTTLNIGKIAGGKAVNLVPEECNIELEFRTISKDQNSDIIDNVSRMANKYNCEVVVELLIDAMICRNDEFIGVIEELSSSKATTVNYVTEASFIQNNECDVIILGPGPMNAHKPDEFVNKEDLYKLTNIFRKTIEYYCY